MKDISGRLITKELTTLLDLEKVIYDNRIADVEFVDGIRLIRSPLIMVTKDNQILGYTSNTIYEERIRENNISLFRFDNEQEEYNPNEERKSHLKKLKISSGLIELKNTQIITGDIPLLDFLVHYKNTFWDHYFILEENNIYYYVDNESLKESVAIKLMFSIFLIYWERKISNLIAGLDKDIILKYEEDLIYLSH